MKQYTKEQIDKANETELVPFLMNLGERFKKSGKEFRWTTHDSVTINRNQWFRFSNNTGGGPVDFLMEFYGKSFPEAVEMLLGESGENTSGTSGKWDEGSQVVCPIPKPELKLPERNEDCKRVREYLIGKRKLSEEIVDHMIAEGKIYESRDYHSLWDFFQNRKRCKKAAGKQIELRLVSGKKNSCVNHRIKDDIGKKLLWHWQSL